MPAAFSKPLNLLLQYALPLLLLLGLQSVRLSAQNTSTEHLDTIVNQFVTSLKIDGVDTICVYQDYFISGTSGKDRDTSDGRCNYDVIYIPTYVFWVKNGRTFLHKKDNCFDFYTVSIQPYNLWKTFFLFQDSIRHEQILPFSYHDIKTGGYGTISSDHTGQQDFRFITRAEEISLHFDSFDFELVYDGINDMKVNDAYPHNIALKSKYFADQLRARAHEAEKEFLLTKTRRP